jgi:hypothetical protein
VKLVTERGTGRTLG